MSSLQQHDLKTFTWTDNPPQFQPAKLIETSYGGHFYKTPDGRKFPSPTTILSRLAPFEKSPIYPLWVNSLAKKAGVPPNDGIPIARYQSKIAMMNGTRTHSLIENYLKNTPTTGIIPNNPWAHLEKIKPLLHNIDNIRACEIPLYSYSMRIAGTADCIAEYNGKLSLIDFKTSEKKKERKSEQMENYFLQATSYAKMYEELTGQKVDQFAILVSCNDGHVQEFLGRPADYGGLWLQKLKQFESMGGYNN